MKTFLSTTDGIIKETSQFLFEGLYCNDVGMQTHSFRFLV